MCHSEETKAAVMAALLAGQSVTQIAEEYKLPVGTVKAWKYRNCKAINAGTATEVAEDATRKRRIGDLLLTLVETQLESAIERAKLFGDRVWLEKQSAQELAVLHGIDLDKVTRLLEAFAESEDDENTALPQ